MNRFIKFAPAALAASLLLGAVQSNAAVLTPQSPSCSASATTIANAGYVACIGSFNGNIDNQLGDIADTMAQAPTAGFGVAYSPYFSSEDFSALGNPFAQDEGTNDDGVIEFDLAQGGKFVLGIKQGNAFSLYLFDGSLVSGGITSLSIDSNGVVTPRNGETTTVISHVGFFGEEVRPPNEVPAPGALALIGLGLTGLAMRRKLAK